MVVPLAAYLYACQKKKNDKYHRLVQMLAAQAQQH